MTKLTILFKLLLEDDLEQNLILDSIKKTTSWNSSNDEEESKNSWIDIKSSQEGEGDDDIFRKSKLFKSTSSHELSSSSDSNKDSDIQTENEKISVEERKAGILIIHS